VPERTRALTVAEERARMAWDMHDSSGHHLTVIEMGLENVNNCVSSTLRKLGLRDRTQLVLHTIGRER
jgi:signal transduction histidine kinase